MKENKSIRIRTTPNGPDKYIKVYLTSDFDTLDILSIKLRQEDVFRSMCADYGCIVGRVSTKSFGIPNCKISVFIPLSEEDENNQLINFLYPYKGVTDKNEDGIRYNLLSKEKQRTTHQPVGTFPSKREILDNDLVLEVYEKYYKFTTTTNSSGDYMIMGIPVGTHTIHMDVDFSDIGFVSSTPSELIEKGYSENLFESNTRFKKSTNLNELTQIVTQNKSVEILPFWGNSEQCEIGIVRTDFDIQNFEITPSSIFFGSIYADHENNYIETDGDVFQPDADKWGERNNACHIHPDPRFGKVFAATKLEDGTIESLPTQDFGINGRHGDWAFSIPMNRSRKFTDEFGKLVDSSDVFKGLPTEIDVRFVIRFEKNHPNDLIGDKRFGYYRIPNMGNHFGENDAEYYRMKWKRLYTVRQYIPRYNGSSNLIRIRRFLGIQRGNECPWSLKFPFNRINTNLTGIKDNIRYSIPTYVAFKYDAGAIVNDSLSEFISESYEKSYDFYNNWVNGSLYSFIFKTLPSNGSDANSWFSFRSPQGYKFIIDNSGFTENNSATQYNFGPNGGFIDWVPGGTNPFYASHAGSAPNVFLFATNITDLGSITKDTEEFSNPDALFLFDKLPYSSYKLPGYENEGFFETNTDIDGTGISGQIVKSGREEIITRTCEIGQEITINSNGDITSETFDDNIRKWLCENNGGGNYDSSITHKGSNMKTLYNSTNNSKFSFYFYFGMGGGTTNSLDLVKQKFFS